MHFRIPRLPMLIGTLLIGLTACSGGTHVKSDLGIAGAPDWVNQGTQAVKDKDGRLFHGVGSAPALGDMSLQISTADERARAEIARVLSSYMEVVSKDFVAARGNVQPAVEQTISRDIQNLTKLNLVGAKIIGHWRDKKSGMVYSIAELDMKQVKSTVEQLRDMNPDFKNYIGGNADTAFDKVKVTQ